MRQSPIGWREWVALPELEIDRIKAKVDTGARTSALHAHKLEVVEVEGREHAKFRIRPVQRKAKPSVPAQVPIIGWRNVRSSSGEQQLRPVIATALRIGGGTFRVEFTLTSRDEMGFRMLLGRTAVRGRFLIDPGRSFLTSTDD